MNRTASKNLEEAIKLLKEFHDIFMDNGKPRSKLLKTSKIEIYARCNTVRGQNHFCLSTFAIDPMIQNQQVFTTLLLFIEYELTYDSMSVESVLSPRLADFLKRKGFKVTLGDKSSSDFKVHCKNLTKNFNQTKVVNKKEP
tara:strand:+ start:4291 stop:4713 length:423 start_codon:yes stop_codon:yes gene_type:complete